MKTDLKISTNKVNNAVQHVQGKRCKPSIAYLHACHWSCTTCIKLFGYGNTHTIKLHTVEGANERGCLQLYVVLVYLSLFMQWNQTEHRLPKIIFASLVFIHLPSFLSYLLLIQYLITFWPLDCPSLSKHLVFGCCEDSLQASYPDSFICYNLCTVYCPAVYWFPVQAFYDGCIVLRSIQTMHDPKQDQNVS